jgi:predicted DNA-binding protein
MKQERFDMVCPAWLKQALKELSDAKSVTLSEYVKDILKAHVETAKKW